MTKVNHTLNCEMNLPMSIDAPANFAAAATNTYVDLTGQRGSAGVN